MRAFGRDGGCRRQPKDTIVKLTDSQLVIMSAAANRADGSILPFPKTVKLNKGAATLVLKSLLKRKLLTEKPAERETESWRDDHNGQRFALVIAPAGLKAIGVEELPERDEGAMPANSGVTQHKPTQTVGRKKQPEPAARKGTKLAILIELLSCKTGATIEEAAKATGWQHHSIRGAISGALKKRMGLEVTSAPTNDRGRVYRIAAA